MDIKKIGDVILIISGITTLLFSLYLKILGVSLYSLSTIIIFGMIILVLGAAALINE